MRVRREIQVTIDEGEDGNFQALAHLKDDYHEMEVQAEISSPDYLITSVRARMLILPHAECASACASLQRVVGLEIKSGLTKRVGQLIGKTGGCTHLTDLFLEICYTMTMAWRNRYGLDFNGEHLTDDECYSRMLHDVPGLKNSCMVWADGSPLVRRFDAIAAAKK